MATVSGRDGACAAAPWVSLGALLVLVQLLILYAFLSQPQVGKSNDRIDRGGANPAVLGTPGGGGVAGGDAHSRTDILAALYAHTFPEIVPHELRDFVVKEACTRHDGFIKPRPESFKRFAELVSLAASHPELGRRRRRRRQRASGNEHSTAAPATTDDAFLVMQLGNAHLGAAAADVLEACRRCQVLSLEPEAAATDAAGADWWRLPPHVRQVYANDIVDMRRRTYGFLYGDRRADATSIVNPELLDMLSLLKRHEASTDLKVDAFYLDFSMSSASCVSYAWIFKRIFSHNPLAVVGGNLDRESTTSPCLEQALRASAANNRINVFHGQYFWLAHADDEDLQRAAQVTKTNARVWNFSFYIGPSLEALFEGLINHPLNSAKLQDIANIFHQGFASKDSLKLADEDTYVMDPSFVQVVGQWFSMECGAECHQQLFFDALRWGANLQLKRSQPFVILMSNVGSGSFIPKVLDVPNAYVIGMDEFLASTDEELKLQNSMGSILPDGLNPTLVNNKEDAATTRMHLVENMIASQMFQRRRDYVLYRGHLLSALNAILDSMSNGTRLNAVWIDGERFTNQLIVAHMLHQKACADGSVRCGTLDDFCRRSFDAIIRSLLHHNPDIMLFGGGLHKSFISRCLYPSLREFSSRHHLYLYHQPDAAGSWLLSSSLKIEVLSPETISGVLQRTSTHARVEATSPTALQALKDEGFADEELKRDSSALEMDEHGANDGMALDHQDNLRATILATAAARAAHVQEPCLVLEVGAINDALRPRLPTESKFTHRMGFGFQHMEIDTGKNISKKDSTRTQLRGYMVHSSFGVHERRLLMLDGNVENFISRVTTWSGVRVDILSLDIKYVVPEKDPLACAFKLGYILTLFFSHNPLGVAMGDRWLLSGCVRATVIAYASTHGFRVGTDEQRWAIGHIDVFLKLNVANFTMRPRPHRKHALLTALSVARTFQIKQRATTFALVDDPFASLREHETPAWLPKSADIALTQVLSLSASKLDRFKGWLRDIISRLATHDEFHWRPFVVVTIGVGFGAMMANLLKLNPNMYAIGFDDFANSDIYEWQYEKMPSSFRANFSASGLKFRYAAARRAVEVLSGEDATRSLVVGLESLKLENIMSMTARMNVRGFHILMSFLPFDESRCQSVLNETLHAIVAINPSALIVGDGWSFRTCIRRIVSDFAENTEFELIIERDEMSWFISQNAGFMLPPDANVNSWTHAPLRRRADDTVHLGFTAFRVAHSFASSLSAEEKQAADVSIESSKGIMQKRLGSDDQGARVIWKMVSARKMANDSAPVTVLTIGVRRGMRMSYLLAQIKDCIVIGVDRLTRRSRGTRVSVESTTSPDLDLRAAEYVVRTQAPGSENRSLILQEHAQEAIESLSRAHVKVDIVLIDYPGLPAYECVVYYRDILQAIRSYYPDAYVGGDSYKRPCVSKTVETTVTPRGPFKIALYKNSDFWLATADGKSMKWLTG